MQTVYKYNIGCLYSVYRTQLNLKLSFLTQQGCKLLHYSCIVEFVYCKDKMYCYWADYQTWCFIELRRIFCFYKVPFFWKDLRKLKLFQAFQVNFPHTHINIAILSEYISSLEDLQQTKCTTINISVNISTFT